MKSTFTFMLPLLACGSASEVAVSARDINLKIKKRFGLKTAANPYLDLAGNATFSQYLDHSNPSLGTFEQRYWWDASSYKPGGPVFVFNPGEQAADGMLGYLTNETVPGLYAQEFNGAAIVIEHRYWGNSVPFDELTAETLQYHNLPNAMRDMTNFAMNATLEFCEEGDCNANDVPWVLVGGSYSGALAAWTSLKEPGVFHAYHASSAVVQTINDFWSYFLPVAEMLPSNCSADVRAVVQYVDYVFAEGDEDDVAGLKARFGLEDLNAADFAFTLADPLLDWQQDQEATVEFCDYLETHGNTTKAILNNGQGVGLVSALNSYAAYIKETAGCGARGAKCDSYSPNIEWDKPKELDDTRPWQWMVCNEPFGWSQVGPAKSDGTNIVSSQLRPAHYNRRCALAFPETNGFVSGFVTGWTPEHLDDYTGGWGAAAAFERVFFVDGQYDPWRSVTLSSDIRPGGPVVTTPADRFQVRVVQGGVHTPEMLIDRDDANKWSVVQDAFAQMDEWLKDWKKKTY